MLALTMALAIGSAPDAPTMARVDYPRCPIVLGMTETEVHDTLGEFAGVGFSGKNWEMTTYFPQRNPPAFDILRVLYVDGVAAKVWKHKKTLRPRPVRAGEP